LHIFKNNCIDIYIFGFVFAKPFLLRLVAQQTVVKRGLNVTFLVGVLVNHMLKTCSLSA